MRIFDQIYCYPASLMYCLFREVIFISTVFRNWYQQDGWTKESKCHCKLAITYTCRLTDWLMDSGMGWLTWLIDHLVTDWLAGWIMEEITDWLTWLINRIWLTSRLTACFIQLYLSQLVSWSISWSCSEPAS